ncbi:MAG: ATP-dependent DNA helicase RecG [Elusimicrobia bacterium HGW-Elusimicrobia-1]|jgi:ATP-dependent DNA helicase RecG|nr:MAG: ATP-dependent DNA helicase RecG [Elusimicrobia bacterium HGW-Elusimicrobia-3]PKN01839.1 MAG: ATP-dependent DNA helicase RecG [Elusimicrobia bacterium HGW-Elusimicrobia-1]
MSLETSVRFVKGVGPGVAGKLARLGISTVGDLLEHYPVSYQDRTKILAFSELADGIDAFARGKVISAVVSPAGFGLAVFKSTISDGKDVARVTAWRKFNPWARYDIFAALKRDFERGKEVFVWGRVRKSGQDVEITLKEYEPADAGESGRVTGGIIPVYPLTEGIKPAGFRKIMKAAVDGYAASAADFAAASPVVPDGLAPRRRAIAEIHFPPDFEAAERARRSLAFGEYLIFQTAMAVARGVADSRRKPRPLEIRRNLLTGFKANLGFEFTRAQKKAINEIFRDMTSARPMRRILIGDVGSGKTAAAMASMLLSVENSRQAVLVAPTEILARQHFETVSKFTAGLGVKVELVTGATSSRAGSKTAARRRMSSGEADIIIGTHALMEDPVAFADAGVIVIDEQHKFGVSQRLKLRLKAPCADILLMSATPIPRSLAIVMYGDLDVSVIDELPPGRIPVKTMMMTDSEACGFAAKELAGGNKVFIVYPIIDPSENLFIRSAKAEAERLSKEVFADYKVGLLHGRMKSADKAAVMEAFRSGALDVLISTVVIEVGIDVPSATLLIVEHADRYGLAALHQLRGRVGRGDRQSYCVLVADSPTDEGTVRLRVLLETSDGFEVSRADMRMRGAGRIIGTEQHGRGELDLRVVDFEKDKEILETAKKAAALMSRVTPLPPAVKAELALRYGDNIMMPQAG